MYDQARAIVSPGGCQVKATSVIWRHGHALSARPCTYQMGNNKPLTTATNHDMIPQLSNGIGSRMRVSQPALPFSYLDMRFGP